MIPVTLHRFTPQSDPTGDRWVTRLERVGSESGYDYNLIVENPLSGVSYMLEFGIDKDGSLVAQMNDLMLVTAKPDQIKCQSNFTDHSHVVFDKAGSYTLLGRMTE